MQKLKQKFYSLRNKTKKSRLQTGLSAYKKKPAFWGHAYFTCTGRGNEIVLSDERYGLCEDGCAVRVPCFHHSLVMDPWFQVGQLDECQMRVLFLGQFLTDPSPKYPKVNAVCVIMKYIFN
jgi:hypothetical protein